MLFKHCLWHVKGVAAKYFSVIHAPAKRIFWVKPRRTERNKPKFNEGVQHLEKQPYSCYSGWIWPAFSPSLAEKH